jgi:hypothetical protein
MLAALFGYPGGLPAPELSFLAQSRRYAQKAIMPAIFATATQCQICCGVLFSPLAASIRSDGAPPDHPLSRPTD